MTATRRDNLIEPDRLESLVERSDAAGIRALCLHLVALAVLMAVAMVLPASLAWPAWFGYAVVLTFLFCPLHEVIHETAFASRAINRSVGVLFGFVLLLPPRYFRVFHMTHHRYTQDPVRDPELATPKPRTSRQYLWHVSGIPYWIAQGKVLVRHASGAVDDFVPGNKRQVLVREARWFLTVYGLLLLASLLSGNALLWWYWVLPVLTGQPFLRWFLLAEHTNCPLVKDMLDNTRTTYTNPVMQRLCWNMNLHTAHHAYAGIPFHRLPQANGILRDKLIHVADGYLQANRDIYRSLPD